LNKLESFTFGRKFKNLVLLIAILAVDVAAVRERHCAAAAASSSLQRALKPAMHILNKVFDTNIAFLASFVTAVDYLST